MNDQRNIFLAILLAAIVLFGWPVAQGFFFPNAEQASEDVADPNEAAPPANPQTITAPDAGKAVDLKSALTSGPRVAIETPKLSGSLSLKGARFDDLLLTQHRVGQDKDEAPVRLLSPSGTDSAYFGELGWVGAEGVAVPGPSTLWTASGERLTPNNPVLLNWDNGAGLTFQIALSIDDAYMMTAEQRVLNKGTVPVALSTYGAVSRAGESADKSSWTIHVGPMGVFDDKVNYEWDWDDLAEAESGNVSFDDTDWLGFTDHYWLTALVPQDPSATRGYFLHSAKGNIYNVRTQSETATIVQPGQAIKTQTRLFAGAKEVDLLDSYQDRLGIEKFSLAIDWGWFRPIELFFFSILSWLFELTGNFGLAIIGLTFLVRLVLFPVANKQFASMASMRAIQPKQKAIQEKYKDDKPRQQQEMMKLFKEEKVNPLAGCLPIFLQIPVFYALYKLLMLSIDMRHQPFALWIHDLSAPDPLTPVNLFGLLPFDPPAFLHIGVLAIVVGLTMWLQQKLNPAPADPVQKQVFAIMPWALMFILAPFAAGLQLYWATNNILSIGQQKLLYMRHPKMREAIARDEEDRKRKAEEAKAEKGKPDGKGKGKAGA